MSLLCSSDYRLSDDHFHVLTIISRFHFHFQFPIPFPFPFPFPSFTVARLCVLRNPYLVDCCGVSFCQSCIEPIQHRNKSCSLCNVVFTTCMPDKKLQHSLNGMKVYCSHKEFGCEWIGELGKLSQYLLKY